MKWGSGASKILTAFPRLVHFLGNCVEERPWWPIQWKKEESERLRGERGQIEFSDLRFARWQVVRFRNARRKQDVP